MMSELFIPDEIRDAIMLHPTTFAFIDYVISEGGNNRSVAAQYLAEYNSPANNFFTIDDLTDDSTANINILTTIKTLYDIAEGVFPISTMLSMSRGLKKSFGAMEDVTTMLHQLELNGILEITQKKLPTRFVEGQNVFSNSLLEAVKNDPYVKKSVGIWYRSKEMLSKMTVTLTDEAQEIINTILSSMTRDFRDKEELYEYVNSSLYGMHYIQDYIGRNTLMGKPVMTPVMLLAEDSFINMEEQFKIMKTNFPNNPFLNNLADETTIGFQKTRAKVLVTVKTDSYSERNGDFEQMIDRSIAELMSDPKEITLRKEEVVEKDGVKDTVINTYTFTPADFIENLKLYLLYKDGNKFANGSFINLLPNELQKDYSDVGKELLKDTSLINDYADEIVENFLLTREAKELHKSFMPLFIGKREKTVEMKDTVEDLDATDFEGEVEVEGEPKKEMVSFFRTELKFSFNTEKQLNDAKANFRIKERKLAVPLVFVDKDGEKYVLDKANTVHSKKTGYNEKTKRPINEYTNTVQGIFDMENSPFSKSEGVIWLDLDNPQSAGVRLVFKHVPITANNKVHGAIVNHVDTYVYSKVGEFYERQAANSTTAYLNMDSTISNAIYNEHLMSESETEVVLKDFSKQDVLYFDNKNGANFHLKKQFTKNHLTTYLKIPFNFNNGTTRILNTTKKIDLEQKKSKIAPLLKETDPQEMIDAAYQVLLDSKATQEKHGMTYVLQSEKARTILRLLNRYLKNSFDVSEDILYIDATPNGEGTIETVQHRGKDYSIKVNESKITLTESQSDSLSALGLTQEEFDALPTQLQESIKICYL